MMATIYYFLFLEMEIKCMRRYKGEEESDTGVSILVQSKAALEDERKDR